MEILKEKNKNFAKKICGFTYSEFIQKCQEHVKGGFFSESAIRFPNLQKKKIFQKNYP